MVGMESLIPGLIGGVASMFSGGTDAEMTPEQQALWRRWKNFIGSEKRYARSAPLSTTLEQQGLANSSALLSQAQQRNVQGLFGQMAPTALGNPSTADALKNVAQANSAQQGSLYADAFQNSIQDRRNAKMRIPGYLQGMAGLANNPGVPAQSGGMDNLLPLLFKFGQQWGQRGTGQATPSPSPGTQTDAPGSTDRDPYWGDAGSFWG